MKKLSFVMLISIILFTFSSCSEQKQTVQKNIYALGTVITSTVYGNNSDELEKALHNAYGLVKELEKTASFKDENSELSKLNSTALNNPVKVSETLFYLIKSGLEWAEKTDGAIDITIGKLTKLWAIGTENAHVPENYEIEQLICENGWKKIVIDEKKSTVMFTDERLAIDLGAVAKGYAGELMRNSLLSDGVNEAILDIGGNIITIGNNDNSLWNIGITNPKSPNTSIIGKIYIGQSAIVTSGNYERYFEQDGKRYCHILDGKTGFPADSGIISATIICENSFTADCLSTVCYVLGKEKAEQLIKSMENVSAVLIDSDYNVFTVNPSDSEIIIYDT